MLPQTFADKSAGKPIWEVGSDKVCGDKLCSELEIETQKEKVIIEQEIIPPKIQVKNGILPKDVDCNPGLFLIKKGAPNSNSVACVKFDTALTLIQRGWNPHHHTLEKIQPHLDEIEPFSYFPIFNSTIP